MIRKQLPFQTGCVCASVLRVLPEGMNKTMWGSAPAMN